MRKGRPIGRTVGLLLALGTLGCSSLSVAHIEREDGKKTSGGIRYTLSKPVWNVRVKGTVDGQMVPGAQEVFEVDVDPSYVVDPRHVYEVNMQRGLFSSDGVTISVGEAGTVASVDATSEPQIVEAVRVVAAIAGTVLRGGGFAVASAPQPLSDEEIRLVRLEEQLVAAIATVAASVATKPTKAETENLQLLQAQLVVTRAALADVRAKIKTLAEPPTGNTVSRTYQLDSWVCAKWPTAEKLKRMVGTRAAVLIAPPGAGDAMDEGSDGCRRWDDAAPAQLTKTKP